MEEQKLSKSDINRLRDEITLSSIFYLVLFGAIILLILAVVFVLVIIFEKRPADGILIRGVKFLGFTFLIYSVLVHHNVITYFDLKLNQKLSFSTDRYTINKIKDDYVLKVEHPVRLKLNIYDDIIPLLQQNKPIKVEVAKWSKTLLSISQKDVNLLETVEKENI